MDTRIVHRDPVIWERLLLIALAALAVLCSTAQIVNEDALRRIQLDAHEGAITSLEMMPDGHTIAAGCGHNGGVLLIDTNGWRITQRFATSGFKDGARLDASSDGRYLHLEELSRFANASAKDLRGQQSIMDAASGAIVLDAGRAIDGAMSAVGTLIATLNGSTIRVQAIPDGQEVRRIEIPEATNAIAISPNGAIIAVSHRCTAELLATVPSMRADKKAQKAAIKYRQMVSFYSLVDGRLMSTVPEIYHIVRAMEFNAMGTELLVYSTADPRIAADPTMAQAWNLSMVDQQGVVELVDVGQHAPLRTSFMSLMNEPFLLIDPSGNTLALSSTEGRNKRKLMLFDVHTGDTHLLIDLEQKHRYDTGEEEQHDGRVAYTWLPDGRLLVALGGNLGTLAQ